MPLEELLSPMEQTKALDKHPFGDLRSQVQRDNLCQAQAAHSRLYLQQEGWLTKEQGDEAYYNGVNAGIDSGRIGYVPESAVAAAVKAERERIRQFISDSLDSEIFEQFAHLIDYYDRWQSLKEGKL